MLALAQIYEDKFAGVTDEVDYSIDEDPAQDLSYISLQLLELESLE